MVYHIYFNDCDMLFCHHEFSNDNVMIINVTNVLQYCFITLSLSLSLSLSVCACMSVCPPLSLSLSLSPCVCACVGVIRRTDGEIFNR